LTNVKEIVNHLRSNKNIKKTERTMSRTHKSDRETRPITDHDRRARGVKCSDKREDNRIRSSVVRGTRVSNPLVADQRCQAHGAEGPRQSVLIPPSWPCRRLVRLRGRRWSPGRCVGRCTREHGSRLEWRARLPSLTLEGPHRDIP
jgi:hypothetical protein